MAKWDRKHEFKACLIKSCPLPHKRLGIPTNNLIVKVNGVFEAFEKVHAEKTIERESWAFMIQKTYHDVILLNGTGLNII